MTRKDKKQQLVRLRWANQKAPGCKDGVSREGIKFLHQDVIEKHLSRYREEDAS